MRSITLLLLMSSLATAETVTFGSGENSFEIEFVEVGDPGNAPDDVIRFCTAPSPQCDPQETGAVDYVYHIAKFEISREIVEKAKLLGSLEITLDSMEAFGGPLPDMPATGVSRNEAFLFVNWLNGDVGAHVAYRESSPPTWGSSSADDNQFRHRLARFALPTADEWHKAAFYDPQKGGEGGYWTYATGSDEEPLPVAWGTAEGTAVFDQPLQQPAGVEVAGGLSAYGVMGMSGNAVEWEETAFDLHNDGSDRDFGTRGLSWGAPEASTSTVRGKLPSGTEIPDVGFRVVMLSVPEFELGDINFDAVINELDINTVSSAVFKSSSDPLFDLNEDGRVDNKDRVFLVEEILGTHFGDVDLNREVGFDDFLILSAGFGLGGRWQEGDVDGDFEVDFDDFLILSTNFGLKGEGVAAATVPEPSCGVLILGLLCFAAFHPSRKWTS